MTGGGEGGCSNGGGSCGWDGSSYGWGGGCDGRGIRIGDETRIRKDHKEGYNSV